jgi:cyanophycinase
LKKHDDHPPGHRGYIVPIGGAEERGRDPRILERFVSICGGPKAHIAIIPTASRLRDTGARYEATFSELGVERATSLPYEQRIDCQRPDWLKVLEDADGVFFTGGNQLRLSTTLGGTIVARTLRRRNQEGQHIAGTSAGAAIMSEHMIAFGDEGSTPRANMVTLAPGLGLTEKLIVDQHFRQRDRLGRLLTALAYNPEAIGLGLDEDTAAFLSSDDVLEVRGSGALTIVDPQDVEFTSMDSSHQDDPVCIVGLRVHVLTDGATFDLGDRSVGIPRRRRRRAK